MIFKDAFLLKQEHLLNSKLSPGLFWEEKVEGGWIWLGSAL